MADFHTSDPKVVWNATLAQSAYNWVSTCPASVAHSTTTNGENLAVWFSSTPTTYQANVYAAPGVVGLQSLGSPGRLGGEPSAYTALQGNRACIARTPFANAPDRAGLHGQCGVALLCQLRCGFDRRLTVLC